MDAKVRVEDLVMIFGKSPEREALPMLKEGFSKEEILAKTGHVVGLSNVSFTVKQGEIFVVMGLSGSGKSTLIRCINRLIEPTSGQIFIDNEDVLTYNDQQLRDLRRTKVSMVFQHFALFPHRTVVENVGYGLKIRGISIEERRDIAIQALDMVGLKQWADRYPHNLSGGMKQRVGLARALATDADILLMDEAFSALDPLIRRQMQNEMIGLQETLQKTIIFITHDLNEALRVGNHVAVMKDGYIVQIGTPVEIVTQPANDYVAAFMADVDQGRVLTAEVVMQPANVLEMGRFAVEEVWKRARALDDTSDYYVVDGQQKLAGLLSKQALLRAKKADDIQDISSVLNRDYPRAELSSTLTDLYALCRHGVPVAVVDKTDRLVGVVNPLDVLATLATAEEAAEEAEASTLAGNGTSTGNGHSNGHSAAANADVVATAEPAAANGNGQATEAPEPKQN